MYMPPAKNHAIKQSFSTRATLDDGRSTAIHVALYKRNAFQPRLVLFDQETRLLDWCKANHIDEALTGGFFLRKHHKPLGEMWIQGLQQSSVAFSVPWHTTRGSLSIETNSIAIDHRHLLPATPSGDLLQAGPLLVKNGKSLLSHDADAEGFSATSYQFDSDITIKRHPRTAIGVNATHILSVVCDGRSADDTGMLLPELAETMINLGCDEALNLDGGGSASLITDGKLLNTPRGDGQEYLEGRPLFTAIVFDAI